MKDLFVIFLSRFRFHRVSLIVVIIFSMVSTLLPSSFARAMTSDTYWRGGLYPQSLIDNGSTSAGRKASDAEYVFHPTSNWTTLAMDLESGNFLFHAHLLSIQGISLSIPFFLTYNSMNAGEDIGLGKGWVSNLHSCVSEDDQTHDITYISPTGAKLVFSYDSQSQSWDNPTGFTGSLTKNISSEYILTSLEGMTQTFDSSGKLTNISPRDGIGCVA